MSEEKKRYWLKLDKTFLKSPQIKVVRSMNNGKDYILFYLSIMLESVETVGHLRFSDLVPYNEDMLSAITDTNVDIVRSAVKIFNELGLLDILDDGTIYLTQVAQMTGKESESADRVRKFRERQNILALQCNGEVTNSNDNKEKEKEKDKQSKETDKSKITHAYGEYGWVKLTQEQYDRLANDYGFEKLDNQIQLLDEYIQSTKNKNKYKDWNLLLRKSLRENWFTKNNKQQSGNIFMDIARERGIIND